MLYVALAAFVILSIVMFAIARKKINDCKTDEERIAVKAKWQKISSIFGAICVFVVVIIMFIIILK